MIPLKTTLTINAASSGFTGIGLIVLAGSVAELFEVTQSTPFFATGVFLILFAAYVLSVAFRKVVQPKSVRLIIALDILWVIASLLLVAFSFSMISAVGIFLILAVAAWVALMVFLQSKGLTSMAAMMIIAVVSMVNPLLAQSEYDDSVLTNLKGDCIEKEAVNVARDFMIGVQLKDHGKVASLIDSLIHWEQPGKNIFSGSKYNSKEVFIMFRGFIEKSASTLSLKGFKILGVNANQVVCFLHWTAAQPSGATLDVDNVDVYTIKNGKIIHAVVYSANPVMEDRFWGSR